MSSYVLYRYALFLIISGFFGFAYSGFEAKAKTSLIMGSNFLIILSL